MPVGGDMMPVWMLPEARALIAAVLFALAFAAGWTANGWRLDATISQLGLDHTNEIKRMSEGARNREKELQREMDAREAAWALAGSEIYRRLQDATDDNSRLRADVDAGRRRLRVAATCPDSNRVPDTGTAAGLDHGAGAELTPDARSDYFALIDGIELITRQLEACQARLK